MLDSCCNYSSEDDKLSDDTEYKIEEESSLLDHCYSSSDDDDEEEIIKSKKSKKRKSSFKWSEEDEILVLKELGEFPAGDHKSSYSKQVFYEYVKKRLSSSKNEEEMSEKMDGLRNEYLRNESRGRKENGLEFLGGLHQRRVFVLSKRVWGAEYHKNNNRIMLKDLRGFMEFLGEMEIDVNCLTLSCLEDLNKEWQLQLLMYMELLSNKSKFDAKLLELILHTKSPNNL